MLSVFRKKFLRRVSVFQLPLFICAVIEFLTKKTLALLPTDDAR